MPTVTINGTACEFEPGQTILQAANDAGVDTSSCTPTGPGAESLCGVWTDPDFDPERRAVYYARVVENPSCRQTGWACAADDPPAWCRMPDLAMTTQERAWTSPIWYTP